MQHRRFGVSPSATLATACALAFVSGLAALAHQMVWTRRLVDLLGASSLTFSKVLGAFFLGLAAGAALAAVRSRPVKHPWRWVAAIELAIAVSALPALLSPHLAQILYQSPQLRESLSFLIPFLLVTPPAVAMGFVIPWMLRALAARPSGIGSAATRLYAANTLGGVAGIAGVLLLILPGLGLTGAGLAACGFNLFSAVIALWLDHISRETEDTTVVSFVTPIPRGPLSGLSSDKSFAPLLAGFCSGFFVLSLEVMLQHQFSQVTINSLFSSGTVLAWGLLSLAAGSMLSPWVARRFTDRTYRMWIVLAGTAVACVIEPFIFTGMRNGVDILPYELRPAAYTWEVARLALIALCPVFVMAGLLFPLLLDEAAASSAPLAGRRIASLLAWNGFGGWAGSEMTQRFIAPHFGLWQGVVVIGLGYALLAALFPILVTRAKSTATASAPPPHFTWLTLPVGCFIAVAFFFLGEEPQVTLRPGERLAALQVGREGVVATVECAPGDWRIVFNNSYTLGGSKARSNQEREAHLPILLHGRARSVGILGVATGGTLSGAALHPGIERIDAAELSPLVLQQARKFFDPYSHGMFQDPRVHLFVEDARWLAATHHQAYDVVIGDLFLPWRTGEARLFSAEHFQAVRQALKPDGVFCQWLPMFQLTRPQFENIARTFQSVFPDAVIVRGDFYTELPILGLVGGRSLSQIDWQLVAQGCEKLRGVPLVTDPLVRHAEGLAMMMVGPLPASSPGTLNTLNNAWLEWDCGHNIMGMPLPWFIGIPEAEFVRDIQRAAQADMPAALQSAHESGQFFLTLEIAAKLNLPQLQNFEAQIPDRLPSALRDDGEAQWQEWPMRIKPNPAAIRRQLSQN